MHLLRGSDLDDPTLPGQTREFRYAGLLLFTSTQVFLLRTEEKKAPTPLMSHFDLAGVADLIKSGKAMNIVCMCGAGISVSAGIPDFRTPGTGLYSQLAKYQLERPEDIFSIGYFMRKPEPFFTLARELFPGNYTPTPTHYFMQLLYKKGLLLRCFTQNIDSLEHQAGLPKSIKLDCPR
eukprot:gene5997-5288_t